MTCENNMMIHKNIDISCFLFPLQLLLEHAEAIAPDPHDPIHAILKELGSNPSIESLLGELNA